MNWRAGMVGTGWMGDMIAPDFAACDGIDLVAVAGRDLEKTRTFAVERGIPRAVSVDRLLADDELDLIYVATTHDLHYDITRAALEAGKAVLVEKAFTVNAAQAVELIELARERGLFLMEAMWMRFNPVIRQVAELVEAGAIGEPRTVHASFGAPFTDLSSRLWDPARAGGSLLDQGVYPLAFSDLFFGEPSTVAVAGSTSRFDGTDAGVDTELAMLLGFDGGRQALLSSSLRALLPLEASVGGSAGRISVDQAFWATEGYRLILPDVGREPEHHRIPKEGNGYVPMLRAVVEALENGWLEHPLSDHAATLRVMRTADRVRAGLLGERP